MNSVPSKEEPAEDSTRISSFTSTSHDDGDSNRLVYKEPLAFFKPKAKSHEFEERVIVVNDVVKISRAFGKSVVPSRDNAYFDCKVLSRNHAQLFYQDKKVRTLFLSIRFF